MQVGRRKFLPDVALAVVVAFLLTPLSVADEKDGDKTPKPLRGLLGENNPKVRRENGKTYIWAGGAKSGPDAQWYDFTGSPIDPATLQFGIGKDRIRAIDDPIYVKPDDPRLLKHGKSRYRPDDNATSNDEIMVSGLVVGNEARAYPIALLDHHELVNDTIGGKPVTVGW